jgi:hypothetical protein
MKEVTRVLPAKVPVAPDVAEAALDYAREYVRRCRFEPSQELGVPVLHPLAAPIIVRRLLKHYAQTSSFALAKIVGDAMCGDAESDLVLRELISETLGKGEPLPAALLTFNDWLIRPDAQRPQRRPWKQLPNLMANVLIVALVDDLIRNFPLAPTRSLTSSKRVVTGCSIASVALTEVGLHRGGEGAVQRTWFDFKGHCL